MHVTANLCSVNVASAGFGLWARQERFVVGSGPVLGLIDLEAVEINLLELVAKNSQDGSGFTASGCPYNEDNVLPLNHLF